MPVVLITGISGFIGRALAERLARENEVVGLSRAPVAVAGATTYEGDFTRPQALARLDGHEIDVCVHLAAVTGGCSEEDGLRVNVAGTHGLMRYLADRGCRKFVMASSIALVGIQSPRFRPLQVPIPDEHPCLDRDGYGWSKYLMEETTRYFARQDPELDIVNIRLAAILPEAAAPDPVRAADPLTAWALARLSRMYLSDAVACFALAAAAPRQPGVRILNAVAATACAADPVPDILRAWFGADADRLDFASYERPGHERDPLYCIARAAAEIGFRPRRPTI